MSSNGFPSGEFLIVNEKSGLCLAAYPGGDSSVGTDHYRDGGSIEYTRTDPPSVVLEEVRPSGKNEFQGWYFDTSVNSHGWQANLLTHRKHFAPYGKFSLFGTYENQYGRVAGGLTLQGLGTSTHQTWKAEDGFLSTHVTDGPLYLSVLDYKDDGVPPKAKMMERAHTEEGRKQRTAQLERLGELSKKIDEAAKAGKGDDPQVREWVEELQKVQSERKATYRVREEWQKWKFVKFS
ncbi:hypothetical protein [Streptomyces sp. NPDC001568]|uniref:hypothetical protein n=1 Tax=Streptomyces sp. NPDC001568 TaxID=3364588 RepID=UPI0036BF5887